MSDEGKLERIETDAQPPAAMPQMVPQLRNDHKMVCDSCFLADRGCPEFEPGADCSINFAELFTTAENRDHAVQESVYHMLELQFERVQRSAAMERKNEGILDPVTSQEITRYFDILNRIRQLGRDDSRVSINASGKAAHGLLSQLLKQEGNNSNK